MSVRARESLPGRARRAALVLALVLVPGLPSAAQSTREPLVPVAWNRFYDYDGVVEICRRLALAWPDVCRLDFIGSSYEGRPMPLLTIGNPATGPVVLDPDTGAVPRKPAMWVDGNVHGNEVQGAEAALYLAWTLLERYDDLPSIRRQVDDSIFYILPMVNPDGRQHWFEAPNTMHSSRSGKQPTDNDHDGLFDEDGPDDLDGDGELLSMRKHVEPGTGTHRLDPDDPRILVRVAPEKVVETGADWIRLGQEGLDNDGDGEVNEDGPGGYDMNRNWPSDWRPGFIQYGAGDFPFCYPETAAIGEFILAHPNIAAVQSFHNSGGMILRGPGTAARADFYPPEDLAVYRAIGEEGEAILPHYDLLVLHEDLYDVHGGFVDWTAEGLGIISFTNELWADSQYFGDDESVARGGRGDASAIERRHQFDDDVMFGETFVDWHEVEHPDYGTVEVGGFRKMTGRTPPTFMIEEMLHRNAAFCIHHAQQMPAVVVAGLEVADGPGDARFVTLELRNEHWIPTRTALAAQRGIGRPDLVTLAGEDVEVVAGGRDADRFDLAEFEAVEHEPARLRLEEGIRGHGTERLRWIVRGSGPFTVTFDSQKGGVVTAEGAL